MQSPYPNPGSYRHNFCHGSDVEDEAAEIEVKEWLVVDCFEVVDSELDRLEVVEFGKNEVALAIVMNIIAGGRIENIATGALMVVAR